MRINEKTAKIQLTIQGIPHHGFEVGLTIGFIFLCSKRCRVQQQTNDKVNKTFRDKLGIWIQVITMYVRLNLGFNATT